MNNNQSFIPVMMILLGAIGLSVLLLVTLSDENELNTAGAENTGPVKLEKRTAFSPFGYRHEPFGKEKSVVKPQIVAKVEAEVNPEEVLQEVVLDEDAIASFALSVTMDDPRAPPIRRSEPKPATPKEVLDDPLQYAEYEAGQRRQLLQQYVTAAKAKVDRLNQLIAEGKARGISDEKLQEGLRKVAALKEGIALVKGEL